MIYDGQYRAAEVNGDHFVYRPLLRQQRECLESMFRSMPAHLAEKLEREIVEQQIVVADWGIAVRDMDDDTYRKVGTLVIGYGNEAQEQADEENLAEFVRLRKSHPWLANSSCASCRTWLWNPLTGEQYSNVNDDGEKEPIRRPKGYPLACDAGVCPKGHWKNPVELSEKNRLALQHYETSAGESDPIASRTRWVIEHAEHHQRANRKADVRAGGRGSAADQQGGDRLRRTGGGGADGTGIGTDAGPAAAGDERAAPAGADGGSGRGLSERISRAIGRWFGAC